MVRKSTLFILISLFFITNCSDRKNSDATIERQLIGTWHKDLKINGKVTHVVTKFTKDHRFATYAHLKGTNRKLYAVGTWSVKFGILNETVYKSNYVQPYTTTYDKILSITNRQFVYKTESGEVFSYYRSR